MNIHTNHNFSRSAGHAEMFGYSLNSIMLDECNRSEKWTDKQVRQMILMILLASENFFDGQQVMLENLVSFFGSKQEDRVISILLNDLALKVDLAEWDVLLLRDQEKAMTFAAMWWSDEPIENITTLSRHRRYELELVFEDVFNMMGVAVHDH